MIFFLVIRSIHWTHKQVSKELFPLLLFIFIHFLQSFASLLLSQWSSRKVLWVQRAAVRKKRKQCQQRQAFHFHASTFSPALNASCCWCVITNGCEKRQGKETAREEQCWTREHAWMHIGCKCATPASSLISVVLISFLPSWKWE